jgi:hypothetical protein
MPLGRKFQPPVRSRFVPDYQSNSKQFLVPQAPTRCQWRKLRALDNGPNPTKDCELIHWASASPVVMSFGPCHEAMNSRFVSVLETQNPRMWLGLRRNGQLLARPYYVRIRANHSNIRVINLPPQRLRPVTVKLEGD